MEPDHIESDYHLMELALLTGDTTLFRSLADRLLERDTLTELRGFIRGLTALHENTPAAWEAYGDYVRADGGRMLSDVVGQAFMMTRGLDELVGIARDIEARAVTPGEAREALNMQIQILANGGRPEEAVRASERMLRLQGPSWQQEQLQLAAWIGMAWDGDRAAGQAAVEELRLLLEEEARRDGAPPLPFMVCTVAVIDLLDGSADWSERALPWLDRGAAELTQPLEQTQARSCPVIIRAGVAHLRGPPDEARRRLRELDTFLTESPFGAKRLRAAANLLAISLHEAAGDLPAALAAAQRLQDRVSPGLLSTAIREEGRLLERLGRRDEAAAVYRHYLAIRTSPEPAVRVVDDRIRSRLAALEQETR
jgi:tetratricopeptide (TPR) repeat protein